MPRLSARSIAATAAVLCAVALPSSADASTTATRAASAASTTVVHVSPVDAAGRLVSGYRVTHRLGGAHCLAASIATGDAYRCFAQNLIIDPCWVTAQRAYVMCLTEPSSRDVWRLHVTQGYDNSASRYVSPATYPWAVRLSTGAQCRFFQGATGTVNGRRLSYGCVGSHDDLVGNPDRSHSLWRIRLAKDQGNYHYKVVGWVTIARAYFGKASRRG